MGSRSYTNKTHSCTNGFAFRQGAGGRYFRAPVRYNLRVDRRGIYKLVAEFAAFAGTSDALLHAAIGAMRIIRGIRLSHLIWLRDFWPRRCADPEPG